jgi:hypothetical protein
LKFVIDFFETLHIKFREHPFSSCQIVRFRQTDGQIKERLDTQKNMRKLTASFQQFVIAEAPVRAKGINKYEHEQQF